MAAAIVLAVWVSRPPVTDSSRATDVGRTAAAPTEDFRLKAEATQSQENFTPPRETLTPPQETLTPLRAVATPDCVASGLSRKAAAGGCTSTPRIRSRERTAARSSAGRVNVLDPPVIVEPARALAIARLRELMTQGRLNEKMLPPPVTPEAALAELSIAPLEIAEIRVPDVEIVGRPPAAPERH